MPKLLDKIDKVLIWVILTLLPIFVLPIFPNIHLPAKTALLAIGVLLILIVKLVKIILRGSIELSIGKYDLLVLGIASVYIASSLLLPVNKMDAFFLPGTTTVFVGACLLYLIVNQEKNKGLIKNILFTSATIIGFTTLLSISGILSVIPFLPEGMKVADFSFVGGYLPSFIYLLTVLPMAIGSVINEKDLMNKVFYGVGTVLIGFGIFVSIFNMLPGKSSSLQLPAMGTSWEVAVDSLKANPLLGVGPSNYLTAFNRFRPLSSNNDKNWTSRSTSANSFYVTNLTETGVITLTLFVLIAILYIKSAPGNIEQALIKPETVSLGVILILGLLLPFNITAIVLYFVLLSLSTGTHKVKLPLMSESPIAQTSIGYKIPVLIVTLPLIAIIIYALALSSKFLRAEAAYARSLSALSSNDGGKKSYEQIVKAIQLNPGVDRYRATMSQIDLGLANLIAQKGVENITENDKQIISRAIKEAVDQAKANVSLNPQKAANWELLASIYQSIMPYAKDVDVSAITAYNQAILLDPLNPLTRIAVGGIYYGKGDFDSAADMFKLAVAVKPDYPNSHFNLAAAYREDGKIEKAIEEIKIVISLVEKGSKDYELAQTELTSLESKVGDKPKSTDGIELTEPKPSPTPVIQPQIEVPEPSPVVSPTPDPTPTPQP